MKKLIDLINATPSDVKDRARNVHVDVINARREFKRNLNALVFESNSKAITEKVYYKTIIELYPNEIHKGVFEPVSDKLPCWVWCSCPYYTFMLEYANTKAGSSSIRLSNGAPPKQTNPRAIAFLCKHLFAAVPKVMVEFKRIAKIPPPPPKKTPEKGKPTEKPAEKGKPSGKEK